MPEEEQEGRDTTPLWSGGKRTQSIEFQKVHGWTKDYSRYLDYLTTIDISYSATCHQRNQYENTISLPFNDDKQAGLM